MEITTDGNPDRHGWGYGSKWKRWHITKVGTEKMINPKEREKVACRETRATEKWKHQFEK